MIIRKKLDNSHYAISKICIIKGNMNKIPFFLSYFIIFLNHKQLLILNTFKVVNHLQIQPIVRKEVLSLHVPRSAHRPAEHFLQQM